jgi:hypothetical protein
MWQYVVIWIVALAASYYVAQRKAQRGEQPPGQTSDDGVPIASMDAPIPVVFGTRVVAQPNVVWWGDASVEPITRKGGKK